MKKLLVAFTLLTLGASSFLYADEKTAVWDRIYRNSVNDEMRYAVLLNIRELHDRQFGGLLTDALTDLLTRQIELGNNNDVEVKVRLATSIIQELGELKEVAAADQIFQVYKDTKNFPFLKSEAAMALGKIRATDYLPNLARDLSDINLQPDRDKAAAQEIVAFGLVQSLAEMRDSQGFESVFFSSIGWYGPQRKVKETARAMLKIMVDDPTDPLLKIVQTQPSAASKLEALSAEAASKAPDAGKAKVALAALEDGVRIVSGSVVEATQWGDLRKEAVKVLVQTKDKTPAAVVLLRQQYKTAALARDTSEILAVLQVLGVNGSPDALAYLIELMSGFNVRAATPGLLTDFDVQQIRTILQAFKVAGDAAARPVLLEAQYTDYTPAVKRDIKAALDSLAK
jgi:HEAT repeat protein